LQVALSTFGKMTPMGICEKPGPCPRCSTPTIGHRPNSDLQKVVDAHLKVGDKNTEITREEAPSTLFPSYPFKRAIFRIIGIDTSSSCAMFDLVPTQETSEISKIILDVEKCGGSFRINGPAARTFFNTKVLPNFPKGIKFYPNNDFRCESNEIFKKFIQYIRCNNDFTPAKEIDWIIKLLH
jgi:hypothetical protein